MEYTDETFDAQGRVIRSVKRVAPAVPSGDTIVQAREALKQILARPNVNADMAAIANFLLLLTYEYDVPTPQL